jgi:hypothetical protein
MKNSALSFLITAMLTSYCLAQTQWHTQNSGTNSELTGVCFVDQNNGWISGWTGTILHTTDGGETWNPQTAPPTNAYNSVFFTDALNGWASGYAGIMIHTTDGGQNWISQSSNTNSDLNDLFLLMLIQGGLPGVVYPPSHQILRNEQFYEPPMEGIPGILNISRRMKLFCKAFSLLIITMVMRPGAQEN